MAENTITRKDIRALIRTDYPNEPIQELIAEIILKTTEFNKMPVKDRFASALVAIYGKPIKELKKTDKIIKLSADLEEVQSYVTFNKLKPKTACTRVAKDRANKKFKKVSAKDYKNKASFDRRQKDMNVEKDIYISNETDRLYKAFMRRKDILKDDYSLQMAVASAVEEERDLDFLNALSWIELWLRRYQ